MLEVNINEGMRDKAFKRKEKSLNIYAKQTVSGYNPTLDKNDSWYTGGLGETMFEEVFPTTSFCDKSGFDYLLNNNKIEVKTTRRTNMIPTMDAFLLLPKGEAERCVGQFVFVWIVGILHQEKRGWILGWLGVKEFFDKAKLKRKGEIQSETNFVYPHDSYEIRVKDITPIVITPVVPHSPKIKIKYRCSGEGGEEQGQLF